MFPENDSDNIFKCQYILQSVSSLAIWTLSGVLAKDVGGRELMEVDSRVEWVKGRQQ